MAAFVLPFAVLFWLIIAMWPDEGGIRALAIGGGTFAGLAGLVAIAQAATGTTFGSDKLTELHAAGALFRANSFLFDPNTLGRVSAVALVGVVGAAYLVARRGGRLGPFAIVGGVFAAGLALSVSQSSGLALAAGLVVLLGRMYGGRRLIRVAAIVAAVFVGWTGLGSDSVRDTLTSRERIARASDGRDRLIVGGVSVWRQAPAFGVGVGGFATSYANTLTPEERDRATVFVSHTAPVTVLAELGLVGLALLAWLAAAACRTLADRDRPRAWTRLTILAMLAGVFVHSLLTGALIEDPLVWALLAVGCAVAMPRPSGSHLTKETPPGPPHTDEGLCSPGGRVP